MNNKKLHKSIMRRVYYTYTLRVFANPVLLYGISMFVLLLMLTQFVSLGQVLHNFMQVPVVNYNRFLYNAFTNTEAWTLLILGFLIFTTLSFRFHLRSSGKVLHFAR